MSVLQKGKADKELIEDITLAELLHYVRKYYGWVKSQVVYKHDIEAIDMVYMIVFNKIFRKEQSKNASLFCPKCR